MQSIDDLTYKKYFAQRRPVSKWSVTNTELALKLIDQGLMAQKGLDAADLARENGLWDQAKRILIGEEQIRIFMNDIQPHEPTYTHLQAIPHFTWMQNLIKPANLG